MPVLTSPEIANKFKEKWMMLHPEDVDNVSGSVHLDDSLTSLQWLQDFSILSAYMERPPSSGDLPQDAAHHKHVCPPRGNSSPASPPAGDTAATGMPQSLGKPVTSSSVSAIVTSTSYLHQPVSHNQQVSTPGNPHEEVDYKSNHQVKPPYSYATLICMAMQASKKTKITLSAIYNWITENFCYYRHADPSWQNSIRHNLSLNKCFMKVPRQKDEPGKGGFWQIDPQYADMFVDGVFKRRRMPSNHFSSQRQSKLLSASEPSYYSMGLGYQNGHQLGLGEFQTNTRLQRGGGLGDKRKQSSPKRGCKVARRPKEEAFAPEVKDTEVLKGDFDWSSVFDDVFSGGNSNFEELDIDAALSSLGYEPDFAAQGRNAAGAGKWCGGGFEQPCSYLAGAGAIGALPYEAIQQGPVPPQHFEEMFVEPPRHPWEDLREEAQATLLTLEHSFPFCEGFMTEMQPWERPESYL